MVSSPFIVNQTQVSDPTLLTTQLKKYTCQNCSSTCLACYQQDAKEICMSCKSGF